MKKKNIDIIKQDKIFLWIGFGTILLLMIPLLLIIFRIPLFDPGSGYEVISWSLFDFITMGMLIFGMSSLFVLIARKVKRHRIVLAIVFTLGFLWLWAELAVGIFTNWGS